MNLALALPKCRSLIARRSSEGEIPQIQLMREVAFTLFHVNSGFDLVRRGASVVDLLERMRQTSLFNNLVDLNPHVPAVR